MSERREATSHPVVGMRNVYSSHVARIGYDGATATLRVEYTNGRAVEYAEVSPETADSVISAPSIGAALHAHVRGKHKHAYVS